MSKPVSVPLLDLKAQYAALKDEIRPAVDRVLDSQQCINGPEVAQLEKDVARYSGCKHGIGVSSGTDALLVALMALDVGAGDEVVTTPYTFFATAGSIARLGAKPVFVDIDPRVVQHRPLEDRGGDHPADQGDHAGPPVRPVRRHGPDPGHRRAAQPAGDRGRGPGHRVRVPGAAGRVDGRRRLLLVLPVEEPRGRRRRRGRARPTTTSWPGGWSSSAGTGPKSKYYHDEVGGNFRLDTIHAAVLSVKLRYLDQWTAARQANAAFYTKAIEADPVLRSVVTPPAVVQSRHIFNQYVVRTKDRDGLKDFLKVNQIGTEIYYPVPMHLQKCFADLGYRKGDFPHSEDAALTTLALPIYPEMTEAQKQHVVNTLGAFAAAKTTRRAAAG